MSDQIRCSGCGYNKPTSEEICLRCLATCKVELNNLPHLLIQAGDYLQPGSGGRGSSSGERTIGVNVSALDFVQGADLLHLALDDLLEVPGMSQQAGEGRVHRLAEHQA